MNPTPRTELHRHPERGSHDPAAIHAIVDAAMTCQVGFVVAGRPHVLSTLHARVGDAVYLHGSARSQALVALAAGAEACFTTTILDGLVLARTAFRHSVNYRSVVAFGRGEAVDDDAAKLAALRALIERLVPGRWGELAAPTAAELAATLVVRLSLAEASAKQRAGGPIDPERDRALPIWAGVIPWHEGRGEPIAEPGSAGVAPLPAYLGVMDVIKPTRITPDPVPRT